MIRWLVWMYRGNHQCYGLKSVSLRGIPDFPDWEPWLLQFWAMKPRGFVASHDFWEPTFLGVALNKPMSHFYLLRIFFQPIFGVGVGLIVVVVICCYLLLFVVICCYLLLLLFVVVCCLLLLVLLLLLLLLLLWGCGCLRRHRRRCCHAKRHRLITFSVRNPL